MSARSPPPCSPSPRPSRSRGRSTTRTRSPRDLRLGGELIRVGVLGAKGRMGAQTCAAIEAAADTELAAQVNKGDDREALAGCDVAVDFTRPGAVMENVRSRVDRGLTVVAGTSGFGEDRLAEIRQWLRPDSRVLVVPNFSVGAVLMMRFAQQ